jgi:hypothetical protein
VALASCLINDPDGPLYRTRAGCEVSQLARAATAALTRRGSWPSRPRTPGRSGFPVP